MQNTQVMVGWKHEMMFAKKDGGARVSDNR